MDNSDEKFYFPTKGVQNTDWTQYKLLLPVVAVGNVPQLAIDVVLSTLLEMKQCKLVGRIMTDALLPTCGPDPFALFTNDVMTTCEVFQSVEHKLVIIQLRSPCYKEKRQKFVKQLTEWIKSNNFEETIILSSSFSQFLASSLRANERHPIRFMHTCAFDDKRVSSLFKPVERVDRDTLLPREDGVVHLSGSGITRALFNLCEKESLKTLLVVLYCSEGDNTEDAFAFVSHLNRYIEVDSSNSGTFWHTPISWRNLFGGRIPQGIF